MSIKNSMSVNNFGSSTNPVGAEQPERKNKRRKVMAILAGGLVLGVGAAITLAAWNDSEFASATFGSGKFDIEGSKDGAVFSSDTSAPGKGLTFTVNPTAMAPGDVVYSPFAVQLSATSSYQADVTLSASSTGTIAPELTYSLVSTPTFGCDATAFASGTPIVTDEDAATSGPTNAFALTAKTTPENLCFAVKAKSSLPQGVTGDVTWEFLGTSTTPLP